MIVQIKVPKKALNLNHKHWEDDFSDGINSAETVWQDTTVEPEMLDDFQEENPKDTYRLVTIHED